jgi:hypothetical protein
MLSSKEINQKYKGYFKAVKAYTSMSRYKELVTKKNDKDFSYDDFKDIWESKEYKQLWEEVRK